MFPVTYIAGETVILQGKGVFSVFKWTEMDQNQVIVWLWCL